MQFHEYANLFPLIQGKEFVELKRSVKEHGLAEPIVTYKGKILDGRNRFRACQETGVEPDFFEYGGADPLQFVVTHNLHRRHLDESQRAMVLAKLKSVGSGGNQNGTSAASTKADMAKQLNVSERSGRNASKVLRDGTPELQEKVESGVIKVTPAAKIAAKPPEQQAAAILDMVKPKPATSKEKSLAKDAKAQARVQAPYVRFWGEVMHGKLPPVINGDWLGRAFESNVINSDNIEEITEGVKTIIAYWQNALEVLEDGK